MPEEPQIPTRFPPYITAGTTFKVDRRFVDYPNTDWTYTLLLAGQFTGSKAATADPDGETFHIVLAPSDTQPLNPSGGISLAYTYVERLTATDGEIYDVANGRIMVEPNIGIASPGDYVSYEEKTLAAIEALLSGRITADIENYSIAGRSISKIPIRELIDLRGKYRTLVWRQRNPGKFTSPVNVQFPSTMVGPMPLNRPRLIE